MQMYKLRNETSKKHKPGKAQVGDVRIAQNINGKTHLLKIFGFLTKFW